MKSFTAFPCFLLLLAFSLALAQQSFYDWPHQRVALANSSIHFQYAGSGPPVLLVHGVPEHSPTWDVIGPILAQNYTVIAPDNRGCGESSLAHDDDYSAMGAAADLKGVLDFLNISQVYVVSHDKGVGIASALAANNRQLVKRIVLAEYALPGFGVYEAAETPSPDWTTFSNWQLAFFAVPDAAEFFLAGQERRYLTWYFYHSSYSENAVMSESKLEMYIRAIQKPGFLRSSFEYFGSQWRETVFFNETIRLQPLAMPSLVMGGEASFGNYPVLQSAFKDVVSNVSYDIVPKAGHWIGDENPTWFANRVLQFLDGDAGIPSADLSVLKDQVTIPQQLAMGAMLGGNARRWVA